jgi:ABC-type thiamine transport system ATPase subunit
MHAQMESKIRLRAIMVALLPQLRRQLLTMIYALSGMQWAGILVHTHLVGDSRQIKRQSLLVGLGVPALGNALLKKNANFGRFS